MGRKMRASSWNSKVRRKELLALTSHAFRVYALNFFLMGFNVYGSSFFTALGDGVTSALILSLIHISSAPLYPPSILCYNESCQRASLFCAVQGRGQNGAPVS